MKYRIRKLVFWVPFVGVALFKGCFFLLVWNTLSEFQRSPPWDETLEWTYISTELIESFNKSNVKCFFGLCNHPKSASSSQRLNPVRPVGVADSRTSWMVALATEPLWSCSQKWTEGWIPFAWSMYTAREHLHLMAWQQQFRGSSRTLIGGFPFVKLLTSNIVLRTFWIVAFVQYDFEL